MVVEASAKANTSNMIQYVLHHQCKLLPSPSPPASATCLPKCLFNALNCNAQQLRQRTVLFSHRIYPPRLRRLWWLRRLGRLRGLCRGRSCTPFLVLHRAGWIPGEEGMIKVPPPQQSWSEESYHMSPTWTFKPNTRLMSYDIATLQVTWPFFINVAGTALTFLLPSSNNWSSKKVVVLDELETNQKPPPWGRSGRDEIC